MDKVFCPYCKSECEAEFVDVGVGVPLQVTPYICSNCHASEIGPHDTPRELSSDEKRTGFYEGIKNESLMSVSAPSKKENHED